MKEAGLNISGFCRAEDLDRVKAAGLTCFVSDPKLSGYALHQFPPVAVMRRDIADLKKQISDNSAALRRLNRSDRVGPSCNGTGQHCSKDDISKPRSS
jgi:hypothetical protein